jgi:hypothetical protein
LIGKDKKNLRLRKKYYFEHPTKLKKMKKHSILALCIMIALASCQKSTVTPINNLSASSSQNATTPQSNLNLLTAHPWLYVKYYSNYSNSTGQLVYQRGSKNNSLNLDLNRVKFNVDGTVNEIDQNGNSVPGTWQFTNSDQTAYEVTNMYGTFYSEINVLASKRFEWTDPNAHTHGVMLPVNFYFLTAHTWEYIKYYTNYVNSANPGQLVYKRGSTNNTINLDQNRVTFNKNGTVDEIDQNGTYIPGTWSFTNAQQTAYKVINSHGTFFTNIDSLSSTRFEWTDLNAHTHGVMKFGK